jgi:hypothetical protein
MRFLRAVRVYIRPPSCRPASIPTVSRDPIKPFATIHLFRSTMTQSIPILPSRTEGRPESPETILDSEEERQEFYTLQRDKRRKRKLEKRASASGGEGSGSAREMRRESGDDSIRFLGVKRGRRSDERDEEIQVLDTVVPTAPILRVPAVPRVLVAHASAETISSTSETDDSRPRVDLNRFRYAATKTASSTTGGGPIPTSRKAVAAIRRVTGPGEGMKRYLSTTSVDASGSEDGRTATSGGSAAPVATGKKRAAKGKAVLPEMPVPAEQLKELEACVVCGMAFDRRRTAKTRWVSPGSVCDRSLG